MDWRFRCRGVLNLIKVYEMVKSDLDMRYARLATCSFRHYTMNQARVTSSTTHAVAEPRELEKTLEPSTTKGENDRPRSFHLLIH